MEAREAKRIVINFHLMDHATHNKIVSFIWSIADDCLRDVFVRGKCGFIFPSGSGGVARASLIHRLQDFIPPG